MAGIESPENPTPENERLSPGSLTRYLSSASARRKSVKDEDCKFCRRRIGGRDLINHLETHSYCRTIYFRMFRVTNMEDLLLKKFSCQSCFLTRKTQQVLLPSVLSAPVTVSSLEIQIPVWSLVTPRIELWYSSCSNLTSCIVHPDFSFYIVLL